MNSTWPPLLILRHSSRRGQHDLRPLRQESDAAGAGAVRMPMPLPVSSPCPCSCPYPFPYPCSAQAFRRDVAASKLWDRIVAHAPPLLNAWGVHHSKVWSMTRRGGLNLTCRTLAGAAANCCEGSHSCAFFIRLLTYDLIYGTILDLQSWPAGIRSRVCSRREGHRTHSQLDTRRLQQQDARAVVARLPAQGKRPVPSPCT